MPHPFLSEEWIAAAREIRARYEDEAPRIDIPIRMNQVVTKVPFGDGTIKSHLDTSSGVLVMELGHLENPDLTVTTDYETARHIFLMRDPQLGMQAFLSGKVRIDGDMTKMMVMQTAMPQTDLADQVAAEILAITSDVA
ncbi:MAG: SCP2 sterol-binding domain-containing protein [Actinomycetota bacterium]|jgi:hypothetical protein